MKHHCTEDALQKNGVSGIDLPNTCHLFRILDTRTTGIYIVTCVDCGETVMLVKDVTGNTKIKNKVRENLEKRIKKQESEGGES